MTRDEVKDRIHADPQPIYALMEKAKDGKSYICPFCGHGKGGDGIILNQDQGGKFHCFACEQKGDAIDIYQRIKGIADFNTALAEVAKALNDNGVETEIYWVGKQQVSGCKGCWICKKTKKTFQKP